MSAQDSIADDDLPPGSRLAVEKGETVFVRTFSIPSGNADAIAHGMKQHAEALATLSHPTFPRLIRHQVIGNQFAVTHSERFPVTYIP